MKQLRVIKDFEAMGKKIKTGDILDVVNEGTSVTNVRYKGEVISINSDQEQECTIMVGGFYDQ